MADTVGTLTGRLIFQSDTGMQKAQGEASLLQQRFDDLQTGVVGLGVVMNEERQTVNQNTDAHARHGRQMSEGERVLRRFRQEQRLQHFVMRESMHSLMSLTFALAFLTDGNENASETSKHVEHSLMAAIVAANGAEFALFALSRGLVAAGGAWATFGTTIEGAMFPIMAVIGLGAGLFAFLGAMNAETKKVTDEGIKEFVAAFGKLSDLSKKSFGDELQNRMKEIRAEMENTGTIVVQEFGTGVKYIRNMTAEQEAHRGELSKELDILADISEKMKQEVRDADILRSFHERSNALLLSQGTELQRIDVLIERNKKNVEARKDVETGMALTEAQIVEALDNIDVLEARRTELLRSSRDTMKETLAVSELQYKAGTLTTQEYINTLVQARSLALTDKERLEYDDKIRQAAMDEQDARYKLGLISEAAYLRILEHEASIARSATVKAGIEEKINGVKQDQVARLDKELELGKVNLDTYTRLVGVIAAAATNEKVRAELQAKIKTAVDNEAKARRGLDQLVTEGRDSNITETYTKQRAEEDRTLQKRLWAIQEAKKEALKSGVDVAVADLAEADAVNSAIEAYIRRRGDIDRDEVATIAKARIDSLGTEEDRMRAKYDLEAQLLKDQFDEKKITEEMYNALSAKLLRERADAEAEITQRHIDDILSGVQSVADGLGKALGEGGQEFVRQLQAALEVMRAIVALSAMKSGEDQTAGWLNFAGSVLGFIGMFGTGGELPSGAYVVRRSEAETNKGLLDTLGAATVRGGVPGRDSVFARSGRRMVALAPGERIVSPSFAAIGRAVNEGRITAMEWGGEVTRADAIASVASLDGGRSISSEIRMLHQVTAQLAETLKSFSEEGLKGTLDMTNGQLFLRREQEKLAKYLKRKIVT